MSERAERGGGEEDEQTRRERSELVATSVGVAGSLRSQLATRDEAREIATDIIWIHPLLN